MIDHGDRERLRKVWDDLWERRFNSDDPHDADDSVEADMGDAVRLLSGPADVWIEHRGKMVRTAAHVASALGVHERTVQQWRAGGMPGKPGCYDLPRIFAWVRQNVKFRGGAWE